MTASDGLDPAIVAAIIAAIVAVVTTILAAPLRIWAESIVAGRRLKVEYEYEQRKELANIIAVHHGRLLAACESWHYRLSNLYVNEEKGWLSSPGGYYFLTTCFRFLAVCSLARSFERRAFFIDARIAQERDLEFLNYIRAFFWVVTDPALFAEVDYDETESTDHFFADQLRWICDSFCPREDTCLTFKEFEALSAQPQDPFKDVSAFFHGLNSREERLRWDRIVCFHLLVMAFLNSVGYQTQSSSDEDFRFVVGKVRHPQILSNLTIWLPRLGLEDQAEAKRILEAHVSINLASVTPSSGKT